MTFVETRIENLTPGAENVAWQSSREAELPEFRLPPMLEETEADRIKRRREEALALMDFKGFAGNPTGRIAIKDGYQKLGLPLVRLPVPEYVQ